MPLDDDEEYDSDSDENETNWMEIWALCVSIGLSDSDWENITIPKVRALMKIYNKQVEFEAVLHGGEIKNKKPRKAKYLSDLGIYLKR